MNVRTAEIEDAAAIAEIYNFYVAESHSTFETEAVSESEMRRRVVEIIEKYPFLVSEENDEIVGYCYAARYKQREGYKHSVEVSVYVRDGASGKGIGAALYEQLFVALKSLDVHAVIAGIALPNEASIKLHEKFGFEKVAHFRAVGFKFGRWIDVGYWQRFNR